MIGGTDRRIRRSRTPRNNKHPSTGEAEGDLEAVAYEYGHNCDGHKSS